MNNEIESSSRPKKRSSVSPENAKCNLLQSTAMPLNEVRKDYILNRWVVIATARGRRPTDFPKKEVAKTKSAICPMCPGNEQMTPPAILLYLKQGKKIKKTQDKNGERRKDWLVRVIPNLFPAFSPPPKAEISRQDIFKSDNLVQAVGHHEVLVESPIHDEHPADARPTQLNHVIEAYIDRLRNLSKKPYVKYVSIFRNHGLEAGASLSHAHSQIIATPFIPKTAEEEMKASKRYWQQHKECAFCNMIEKERKSPRFILENTKFTVFAPYASVNPMEFWIFPRKHETSILNFSENDVKTFAETLKTCLHSLKELVNDPPYNYGFHVATERNAKKYYHWHLEVYPKLATWAGFEKSTGVYINTVTPETAAETMRKTISL